MRAAIMVGFRCQQVPNVAWDILAQRAMLELTVAAQGNNERLAPPTAA